MITVVSKRESGTASLGKEHLSRDLRETHGCLGKRVRGRRNSQRKGPGVDACSLGSRNGEEASRGRRG